MLALTVSYFCAKLACRGDNSQSSWVHDATRLSVRRDRSWQMAMCSLEKYKGPRISSRLGSGLYEPPVQMATVLLLYMWERLTTYTCPRCVAESATDDMRYLDKEVCLPSILTRRVGGSVGSHYPHICSVKIHAVCAPRVPLVEVHCLRTNLLRQVAGRVTTSSS